MWPQARCLISWGLSFLNYKIQGMVWVISSSLTLLMFALEFFYWLFHVIFIQFYDESILFSHICDLKPYDGRTFDTSPWPNEESHDRYHLLNTWWNSLLHIPTYLLVWTSSPYSSHCSPNVLNLWSLHYANIKYFLLTFSECWYWYFTNNGN